MSDFLSSGAEDLGDVLKTNSTTKEAFKLLAGVFEEIHDLMNKQDKGKASGLREFLCGLSVWQRVLTVYSLYTLVKRRIKVERAEGATQEGEGASEG